MHVSLKRGRRLNFISVAFIAVSFILAPARAQRVFFDSSRYNPAVLHVYFTPAEGRTTSGETDAFLDAALISASGDVEGFRAELSTTVFREQLRKLYRQLSRQERLNVEDPLVQLTVDFRLFLLRRLAMVSVFLVIALPSRLHPL